MEVFRIVWMGCGKHLSIGKMFDGVHTYLNCGSQVDGERGK